MNDLKRRNISIGKCLDEFWTEEWINGICKQSIIYAEQKSLDHDNITPDNIRVFLCILSLSGYNRNPTRRLYWADSPDVHNELVSSVMRRSTFEQIMRCLRFADNMQINNDRFYKVNILGMCVEYILNSIVHCICM